MSNPQPGKPFGSLPGDSSVMCIDSGTVEDPYFLFTEDSGFQDELCVTDSGLWEGLCCGLSGGRWGFGEEDIWWFLKCIVFIFPNHSSCLSDVVGYVVRRILL